jgi:glycosyltransferase involved in cell wall biosynthesis
MTSSFYPPYHVGGACVHVKNLSEELARMGHEVHVFYSLDAYHAKKASYRGNRVHEAQGAGVHTHAVETLFHASAYLTYILGNFSPIVKHFESLIRETKPDVVHHHNISLLGHRILRKTASYVNIYTAHDYWLLCPMSNLIQRNSNVCENVSCKFCGITRGRPPQLWRYGSAFQDSLRQIDFVIAPCEYMKDRISRKLEFIRQTVIPNFVSDPPESIQSRGFSDRFYLYAGRLEKHKGILDLLDAWKMVNAKLVIVGDGPLMNHVREMIKREPFAGKVAFLGYVNRASLWSLLRDAEALIVPSLWPENNPLTALEAISVGTPVIVSNMGGLPEIAEKVDRSLVYSNHTELVRILSNYNKARYDGERVRNVYRRNYSVSAFMRKYEGLVGSSLAS